MVVNQYEIYWVNLDPTVGSDIKKVRPCIILSPNEMNHHINTVIIAPLTSQEKDYPSRVKVAFDGKDGWVVLDQLRCIDKQRLVRLGGITGSEYFPAIKRKIKEILVD